MLGAAAAKTVAKLIELLNQPKIMTSIPQRRRQTGGHGLAMTEEHDSV